MRIAFAHNDGPSLGVELELTLVDRHTRELVSRATELLAAMAGDADEPHPKAKHELFECTVEIITDPCTTVAEAHDDLAASLRDVRAAAESLGCVPLSVGTHPFSRWQDQRISPDDRYRELVDELQWTARRLAIFGTHFHVGVTSGDTAVAVVNALRSYLPHLIALSASSPFWQGADSGLASTRIKVFESLPTAGLNPSLADWGEFEQLIDTLIRARSIRSIREVWWDIRPHPDFGTVELRMCDAPPTLREVAALAALAQCLVAWLSERAGRGDLEHDHKEWTIRENKWLATRHGIDAELIADATGRRQPARDQIRSLVADLAPTARRLGCVDELAGVEEILDHGPSYARQRSVIAAGGSPADLVDHLAEELRTGEVRGTAAGR